jgi:Protein of unknown function (DUF3761)
MRRVGVVLAALAAAVAVGAPSSHAQTACKRGYYLNVSHICVKSPGADPTGATAQCRDRTYSYSLHASGTCSHHSGVARWIHHP